MSLGAGCLNLNDVCGRRAPEHYSTAWGAGGVVGGWGFTRQLGGTGMGIFFII